MQTVTSDEIYYIVASFRAWCVANNKAAPTAEDAFVYFSYVQANEPFVAEKLDGDWDDFLAFLRERRAVIN
ncbi:MAG: hypothetical protein K2P94_02615 [Rhodospirillaceae bacterium]|nr:hypothetical protein [Rhodospirillaceae bacterium]